MKRHIEFIGIFATLILAIAIPARANAATPSLDKAPVRPTLIRVLEPGNLRHIRNCDKYSDMHVYSRGGRPFEQRRDAEAGNYWVKSNGMAVAGFDRVNCDMISFARRPVLIAFWKEDTR
jgi:hypothetical protein